MINFVAALCVNKENTILRFFLFFLGLDSSSKYYSFFLDPNIRNRLFTYSWPKVLFLLIS